VGDLSLQSLVWSTDIDVLPADRQMRRAEGYWIVHSPGNPGHYWGNMLIFDDAPGAGDRARWETLFARELGGIAGVRHRTFAWDRTDGFEGSAAAEFEAAGYELERSVGLIATPEEVLPHPRSDGGVSVRRLDPEAGDDEPAWQAVLELWAAQDQGRHPVGPYREWARLRIQELRRLFATGHGGWFVALDGDEVVASLGIVVAGTRARYQQVDTRASHRRRGIASRLVADAARLTAEAHPEVAHFVIVADPGYHAVDIYRSLGFRERERVCGACRWPRN
jgi:ribosomal protein S18 acetylase RimI-like enzyme